MLQPPGDWSFCMDEGVEARVKKKAKTERVRRKEGFFLSQCGKILQVSVASGRGEFNSEFDIDMQKLKGGRAPTSRMSR